MEVEEKVDEVEIKETWWLKGKNKVKKFCEDHPDVVLTFIGGAFTLVGGAMKLIAASKEYSDEVYMTDGDNVYKLPAREIKNGNKVKTVKSV